MNENKLDEIRKLFAERAHIQKIDDSQSLKDLGLDSLDVVEMCLSLEDKYGIQFSAEELGDFKTIGDLLNSIAAKLNK